MPEEQPQTPQITPSPSPIPVAAATTQSYDVVAPVAPTEAPPQPMPPTPQATPAIGGPTSTLNATPEAAAQTPATTPAEPLAAAAPVVFAQPSVTNITPPAPLMPGQGFVDGNSVTLNTVPVAPVKSRKVLWLSVAGGVVLLALLASGAFWLLAQRISAKDVATAEATMSTLNSDLLSVDTAMTELNGTSPSDATVKASLTTLHSKFSDAEKQYNSLAGLKVQHNKAVKAAYSEVQTKWKPYDSFLQGDIADLSALAPKIADFDAQATALSAHSPATVAALKGYLTDYKQLIDGMITTITGVRVTVPENQQVVTAFTTFLQSSSAAIGTAQTDLNAGKSGSVVQADINKIFTAESTLGASSDTATAALDKRNKSLNPSAAFSKLQTAINQLTPKH